MRVATWNINGLRARLDFVRIWLADRQPDLVGLQELKMTEEQFPYEAFQEIGYQATVHGQKAWNGVAVLAKGESEVKQIGLPGQEDFGARLLTVEFEGLSFTTLYAPNGKHLAHDDYSRKLAWYEDLVDYLNSAGGPDAPAVVCGDFNICPTGIDSWNEAALSGEIFHTEEERDRIARLEAVGLRDLFRERYPDEQAFSWWDYRGGAFYKKQGLRIDFLLATKPVLERLESVSIDRDYRKKKVGLTASDHAPVMADLG